MTLGIHCLFFADIFDNIVVSFPNKRENCIDLLH